MYLGFYNFYRHYNGNRMFTDPSSPIGDDLMYPLCHLGQRLKQLGHRVATIDTDDLDRFDAVVFLDHPTPLNPYLRKLRRQGSKPLYLFLFENEANRPDNYWRWNHGGFKKIFTWNPRWVDNRKYFQFHLPNKIPAAGVLQPKTGLKFCTTIASQKYIAHPNEIYSERIRAIRWFEAHHPGEFDLFGTGWNRRYFRGRLARLNILLERFYRQYPHRFQAHGFPSYRGTVPSKKETLGGYKFSICYENAVFPGYITEKIFDCLFAGCVPVYLGAPDVGENIPAGAFVDKRHFKTYEALYNYLKGMSDSEYQSHLSAIHSFVTGPLIQPFGAEQFTQLVIDHIVDAHGNTG